MKSATRLLAGLAAIVAVGSSLMAPAIASEGNGYQGRPELTQFAQLPAETFVPNSEPSGAALGTEPINGVTPPFADQPVQGFSGIVRNADGTFDVLSDNGYGTKNNSADYLLRINRIAPDFTTGGIDVVDGFNLRDPDRHVSFPLTRSDRVLTGSDFDPESVIKADDGTYWIGDEFGPFLLHVDSAGRLMSPPVSLPGVFSPENPFRGDTPPNLGSSRGFEGLALSPNRRKAYALLEGTVAGDTAGDLRLNEFDLRKNAFTDRRWVYRLDDRKHAIGDVVAVDKHRFLVIERDNAQGAAAKVKKVYLADRRDRDEDGVMDKRLIVDLLDVSNPDNIGGFGDPFTFPFFTIEGLVILDDWTVGVLNDNNFPSSAGRAPGTPDNNEFITIQLGRPLHADLCVRR